VPVWGWPLILTEIVIMLTVAAAKSERAVRELAKELASLNVPIEVYRHRNGDDDILEVRVEEQDEDKVLEFFKGEEKRRKGMVYCPACGSGYVEYPARPRYSGSAAMVEKLAETLHIRTPAFYCRSCHETWTKA